jgi:hypothetical protein
MRVILMADLQEPRSAELLGGYRDLPHLLKPIRLAELYGALMALVGPLGPTPTPRSVIAPRQRARRGRAADSSGRSVVTCGCRPGRTTEASRPG